MSTIVARGQADGLAGLGRLPRALARNGGVDAVIAEDAQQRGDVGQPRDIGKVSVSSVSRLAIISGRAAFLAPEMGIVPLRARRP